MGGSNDEGGLFEFDQLSDSAESTGNDPPDEPDPPDDGGDANAPMERTTDPNRSDGSSNGAESAGRGAGNSDPSDPPDGAGEASNEPTEVASTESDDGDSGNDGSGDGSDGSSNGDSSGNDPSDPPDPSDGSNGSSDSRFYEFNPVEESQAAVEFAEKHSRAAAKSAYEHAAHSLIGRFIRKYTSPEVRKRLDEVFSRRMLGSVMVGGAFSKMIESALGVSLGAASLLRPIAWTIIFLFATVVFVWWDHLARRASETAEKATEAATEAAEKASEAAQKATETAEKATEAATEATGGASPAETKTADVVGAGVAQSTKNRKAGSTAATRAGGKRPTAVRSHARTPERRPNKRFENEAEEAVPYDEVIAGDEEAVIDPVFEGSGFKDPADTGDA